MVRFLLVLGSVFSLASVSVAQSPAAPVNSTQEAFRIEIGRQLAKHGYGIKLYQKCDLVRREIDREARKQLTIQSLSAAPATGGYPTPLDSAHHVMDITLDPSDQNETTVAINRLNPNLIVAGANDDSMITQSMPSYVTTNGGASWATYRLPPINDNGAIAAGDPIMVCDDRGEFYYSFLIVNFQSPSVSDILVAHSPDGKRWTLGTPVVGNLPDGNGATLFEDKETIAIDRDSTSPYYGRLYVCWTEYYDSQGNSSRNLVAHSDDHGASWSHPTVLNGEYGYFALLRVGAGGTVFIGSSSFDTIGGGHGLLVSHDGGQSFVSRDIWSYTNYPRDNIQRNGLKGPFGFRSFPYVAIDYDFANSALLAVYGTFEKPGYAALYAASSTDEGVTWSARHSIGTPRLIQTDHFQPWVTSDPVTHANYVSYYSSEDDPVYNILTRAARITFESPDRPENLETSNFSPMDVMNSGYRFLGDYTGSDAYGGTFAAVWTQNRPGANDGDAFAYVSTGNPIIPVTQRIADVPYSVGEFVPNPLMGDLAALSVYTGTSTEFSVALYDIRGAVVQHQDFSLSPESYGLMQLDVRFLPSGVYRAVISSGGRQGERTIVILH